MLGSVQAKEGTYGLQGADGGVCQSPISKIGAMLCDKTHQEME